MNQGGCVQNVWLQKQCGNTLITLKHTQWQINTTEQVTFHTSNPGAGQEHSRGQKKIQMVSQWKVKLKKEYKKSAGISSPHCICI